MKRLYAMMLLLPLVLSPQMMPVNARDDVCYQSVQNTPQLTEDSTVINIGINNADIPKEYDRVMLEELTGSRNDNRKINIKRYGSGWFARKKMGFDLYRGSLDYLAVSQKTAESDSFQKARRKYKEKLKVKRVNSFTLTTSENKVLRIVLFRQSPATTPGSDHRQDKSKQSTKQ
jgi:hypothetical protein